MSLFRDRPPGKVIAVHLSYRSRAAERGKIPPFPSYFLKPTSSIAESGAPVVRPDGCELLAFEGEIALVIGARAKRVEVADATYAAQEQDQEERFIHEMISAGESVDGLYPISKKWRPAYEAWRARTEQT